MGDEGLPLKEIAGVIGERLNVPVISRAAEDAADHFGWIAAFASLDMSASSKKTQQALGWQPTEPGLVSELIQSERYF